MNPRVKLVLDILMGGLIPILILNNLNEQLGTVTVYIVAALTSVAWVFLDLFFITKQFNFITTYIGTSAIVRGLLAFWFVDGIQFALKDTIGYIFAVIVFGCSIVIRKPIMHYFVIQTLQPNSKKQERSLRHILREPKVYRSLLTGTKALLMINLLGGIVNFLLNLKIVSADFGSSTFNHQVAQVNTITQIALAIPEFIGIGISIVLFRRAVSFYLPEDDDTEQDDNDFWDLLYLYEDRNSPTNPETLKLRAAKPHKF